MSFCINNDVLYKHVPASIIDKTFHTRSIFSDDTLYATSILMLYDRVPNLEFECYKDVEPIINFLCETKKNPEVFTYYWVTSDTPADSFMTAAKDRFDEVVSLTNIEKWILENTGTKVEIRIIPSENTVCIFSKKIAGNIYHIVQSFINKFFSVFKEKPLTEKEISYLKSLTGESEQTYLRNLKILSEEENFKKYKIVKQIVGLEKSLCKTRYDNAVKELENLQYQMQVLLDNYKEMCEKRFNAVSLVNSLNETLINTPEKSELEEYLLTSKNLCAINIDNRRIKFIVKTYLAPYLFDEWDSIQKRGAIFKSAATNCDAEDVKLLANAIFSEDRCLRLRMCAFFDMDYYGTSVVSSRNFNYAEMDSSLKDYIPNPHIQLHNCFSQNAIDILKQLEYGDVIGAIECAIATAQRVNVTETAPTFEPFLKQLMKFTGKCIVSEDGTEMTPLEAVKYLKEKVNE